MPVHWTNAQSLLQLIVAFNILYFSIVTIASSNEQKAMESNRLAQRSIEELNQDIFFIEEAKRSTKWRGDTPTDGLKKYAKDQQEYLDQFNENYWSEFEAARSRMVVFGYITLLIGVLFTMLLFYATVAVDAEILPVCLGILTIFGTVPVFSFLSLGIRAHYVYETVDREFFKIRVKAGTLLMTVDPPGVDPMDTVGMQLFLYKQQRQP